MQAYTLYSSVRPFGTTAILGVVDKDGPHLFMLEPSGIYWGYHGCAAGKGCQAAKGELEKLDLTNLSMNQAVNEAARIIYLAHDEAKDKEFELEVSWICPDSGGRHELVPESVLEEAIRLAKEALLAKMEL